MILVKPSHKVLTPIGPEILTIIEAAGRTCYKSEHKITETSAIAFCKRLIESGHHSVLEHFNIQVRFICDRGVSHELVRHRLCAFSQESTRYCNYKGGVTFIIPPWLHFKEGEYDSVHDLDVGTDGVFWFNSMIRSEQSYKALLKINWTPQQARSVLPNSLKTEIVVTTNIREWRHILKLRTSSAAHPQMQELMKPLLKEFQDNIPILFDEV